jgi:hypothetical protein
MSVRNTIREFVELGAADVVERVTRPGGLVEQAQVMISLGAALREGITEELTERDPRQLLKPGALPEPVGSLINTVVARRSDGELLICLGAGDAVRRWELEQQVRDEVAEAERRRAAQPAPPAAVSKVARPVDSKETVVALKDRARSLGVKVPRRIKKADLIALIEAAR